MGQEQRELTEIVLIIGLIGFFFLYTLRSPVVKRGLLGCLAVLGGLFLAGNLLSMGFPTQFLIILVPMFVLAIWLSTKRFKFCRHCGATLYKQFWFSKMTYCSKCGSPLDD